MSIEPEIKLEIATKRDIKELLKLDKEIFKGDAFSFYYFAILISNPMNNLNLILRDYSKSSNPNIIAYCNAEKELNEDYKYKLHIVNIAVIKEHRRKGLGKVLMNEMLKWATEQNCISAYLEVRTYNIAAQKLYERYNFKKEKRIKFYYDTGGDAFSMITHCPFNYL